MTAARRDAGAEPFAGFSADAIQFLSDLAANNDRAWFQPRKADYERLLKQPMEALCVALEERFESRGVPLAADPARSPMRIYRDVRFSKDKSPYKTNVAAGFRYVERGSDGTALPTVGRHGGGYFHLQPGEIFVGGGMWHPEPGPLNAWRRLVVEDPSRVHAAIDETAFVACFGSVSGDRLKRPPAGISADHPELALLTLKDVTFGRRLDDHEAMSPDLPDILAADLATAAPLIRLLALLAD